MKLIDLSKKRQVQKASVAAGKDKELKLGVLGIAIGQKQSDGLTSRIMESTGDDAWDLLEALSDALEVPIFTGGGAAEKLKYASEAAKDAVQWYHLYIHDVQKVLDLSHDYLHNLRNSFHPQATGNSMVSVAVYAGRLKNENAPVAPFIADALQKVWDVVKERDRIYWHLGAVEDIWDFIHFVRQKVLNGEEIKQAGKAKDMFDDTDRAFANAALRRLGLQDAS